MPHKRKFIAVVDDEAAVRKALQRLLSSSGIEAQTFDSGRAFIDSLILRRPDCLILDLHMPEMSGLDVLNEITRRGAILPTVILTAHDEPGAQAQCLAAGAKTYLCKPLDEKTLLTAIANAYVIS